MAHQRQQINNPIFRPNSPCWGEHGEFTIPKQVMDFWNGYKALECDCGHVIAWTERATGRVICGSGVATHFDLSNTKPVTPPDDDGHEQSTAATQNVDGHEQSTAATENVDSHEQPTATPENVEDHGRPTATPQNVDGYEQPTATPQNVDSQEQPAATPQNVDSQEQVTNNPQNVDSQEQATTNPQDVDSQEQPTAIPQNVDSQEQATATPQDVDSQEQHSKEVPDSPAATASLKRMDVVEQKRPVSAAKAEDILRHLGIGSIEEISEKVYEAFAFLQQIKFETSYPQRMCDVRLPTNEEHYAKAKASEAALQKQLEQEMETEQASTAKPSVTTNSADESPHVTIDTAKIERREERQEAAEKLKTTEKRQEASEKSKTTEKRQEAAEKSKTIEKLPVPKDLDKMMTEAAAFLTRMQMEPLSPTPEPDPSVTPERSATPKKFCTPEKFSAKVPETRETESPEIPKNPPPSAVSSVESLLEVSQNPQASQARFREVLMPKSMPKFPAFQIPTRPTLRLPANRSAFGRNPKS